MPGTRCAVAACNNSRVKTKLKMQNIIYHKFPSENNSASQKIRKKWIHCCRRTEKWNPTTSQICSIHFTDDDYERDLQHELLNLPLRKWLKKTAVPTLHLGKAEVPKTTQTQKKQREVRLLKRKNKEVVKQCLISYTPSCSPDTQTVVECVSKENWEQKYNELNKAFQDLKQDKAQMVTEIKKLKLQSQFYKNKYQLLLQRQNDEKNLVKNYFTKNQLDLLLNKRKRVNWTSDEAASAFNLQLYSKRAYFYVKHVLNIPLPGLSSLRRWANKTNVST